MGLIKCPACNHDVSTEAKFCPNCGHPIKVEEAPQRKSFTVAYRSGPGSIVPISIIGMVFGGIFLIGGILLFAFVHAPAVFFFASILIALSVLLVVVCCINFHYFACNSRIRHRNCIEYDSEKDKLILCTLYGETIEINAGDYISLKDNWTTDNMLYFTYRTKSGQLRKVKLGYCGNRDDIRANIASIKR